MLKQQDQKKNLEDPRSYLVEQHGKVNSIIFEIHTYQNNFLQ